MWFLILLKKMSDYSNYKDIVEFEEYLDKKNKEFNSSFESEISSETIEDNNIYKLANSINLVLTELIEINKKKNNFNTNDIFDSKLIPNISILDYINRIIDYSKIEENTLIAGLIYIDKIAKVIKITNFNIHKILFSCILIAIKNFEDEIYSNNYFAQIGGINNEELLKLELNISTLLDFKFFISEKTFEQFKAALELMNKNN
jgi:hypothetical protein